MQEQEAGNGDQIALMDQVLASQVAAGEVVERPASVLKELVENSIDAGARRVRVEIERGGVALMRVTDDGCGMSRRDAQMSLLRHATSKLRSLDDLFDIRQLGFRGEALPSIASVAKLSIETRRATDVAGTLLLVEGGEAAEPQSAGCAPGTTISVRELFYNLPARREFLKSEQTESAHVEHQLKLHALCHPQVRFSFVKNGTLIFDTAATTDMRQRISDFFGRILAQQLIAINPTEGPGIKVSGFLLPLSAARRNRNMQYIFLNSRPIDDKLVTRSIRDGFGGFPTGLHPALFLYLEVDPGLVDVNVHPAKREVRFRRSGDVCATIIEAIASSLSAHARQQQAETAPSPAAHVPPALTLRPISPAPRQHKLDLATPTPAPAPTPAPQPTPAPAPLSTPAPITPTPQSGAVVLEPDHYMPIYPVRAGQSLPFRHVGVLHGSYALFEGKEGLILLAPRAARERVIFERLLEAPKRPMLAQRLLMPILVQIDAREISVAEKLCPQLERAGFIASFFGKNTLRIEATPALLPLGEVEAFISDLIESFSPRGETRLPRSRDAYEVFAVQLARKYAQKEDIQTCLREPMMLLADLLNCEIPYCTPGGKPTMVPISMQELGRKFHAR